jgi:hypothetical protein
MEAMPHTREGAFEWEYPAKVYAVVGGDSFLADIDLGLRIHYHAHVRVEGIESPNDLPAKKEAQRLLMDADVVLRCRRVNEDGSVLAEVAYGPWFVPRSEQGSFAAAMLASGHAIVKEAREEPSRT